MKGHPTTSNWYCSRHVIICRHIGWQFTFHSSSIIVVKTQTQWWNLLKPNLWYFCLLSILIQVPVLKIYFFPAKKGVKNPALYVDQICRFHTHFYYPTWSTIITWSWPMMACCYPYLYTIRGVDSKKGFLWWRTTRLNKTWADVRGSLMNLRTNKNPCWNS